MVQATVRKHAPSGACGSGAQVLVSNHNARGNPSSSKCENQGQTQTAGRRLRKEEALPMA
eukprot:2517991-Lingulodinium_polyedra.AAC.1